MRTPRRDGSLRTRCNRLALLCALSSVGGCQTLDVFKDFIEATPQATESGSETLVTESVGKSARFEPATLTELDQDENLSADVLVTGEAEPVFAADAWQDVRDLLSIEPIASPRIDKATKFYAHKQRYFDRIANNAAPYLPYILREIKRRGLPGEIVLLPIIESAYYPYAVSPRNAVGLWQFIPSTGKHFGLRQTWWYDARRDVVASTNAAIEYLEYLNRRVDGDWLLTVAAFNAGEGTIERAIKKNRKAGKAEDYWSLDLPRETLLYVPRLLAMAAIVREPNKHGVVLPEIINEVSFAQVDVGRQIDLALVGELTGADLAEIYQLNPGFKQWASDPEGPHRVLIPKESKAKFLEELAQRGPQPLVTWAHHEIKRNETLGGIAKNYHTSVSTLKKLNNLKSNVIRAGKSLIVPASALPVDSYPLAESNRAQKKVASRSDGKKSIYTIKTGDSLWTIARRHDLRVKDITSWNGIARKTTLQPGQKLTLWLPKQNAPKTQQASAMAVSASALSALTPTSYTVQNGDSLWTISRKFQVTVSDLRKWNQLSKNNLIRPGQTLELYIGTQSSRVES